VEGGRVGRREAAYHFYNITIAQLVKKRLRILITCHATCSTFLPCVKVMLSAVSQLASYQNR
jgi:hypothetical protein